MKTSTPIRIRVCEPDIGELEVRAVTDAIKNTYISSVAPPVKDFEEAFAKYFGAKYAVAVNSGGSALFLALKAIGVGPGDEVIVPTFTMIATAAAVTHCGARPVFIDSSAESFNMDPGAIETLITPRTKAIIPVHLYGESCDMDSIMEIAERYGLKVIEDAAESHGAKYKGKLTGTFGVAGCFSFYANKIMTTGEGGMIITDDDHLAHRLRHMRGYDFDDLKHFWHRTIAWNLRMSALGAALGGAQLARLPELIAKRRANAEYYTERLKSVKDLSFFLEKPDTFSVFWMYSLLAERRDELMNFLSKNGVETRTFFIPMHQQPVYKQKGSFPHADRYAELGLYLPSSSHLSNEQKDEVIALVRAFYGAS